MRLLFSSFLCSFLLLSACSERVINVNKALYWQRVHVADTIHTRGPGAQDQLNRDLARCTIELDELTRKNTLPSDSKDRLSDPAYMKSLATRDPRLVEHGQFYDMASCMLALGWERVEYVPYDEAVDATYTHAEHVEAKEERPNSLND